MKWMHPARILSRAADTPGTSIAKKGASLSKKIDSAIEEDATTAAIKIAMHPEMKAFCSAVIFMPFSAARLRTSLCKSLFVGVSAPLATASGAVAMHMSQHTSDAAHARVAYTVGAIHEACAPFPRRGAPMKCP